MTLDPEFDLIAVSRNQVAHVTGAKLPTIDYWTAKRLVLPVIDTP